MHLGEWVGFALGRVRAPREPKEFRYSGRRGAASLPDSKELGGAEDVDTVYFFAEQSFKIGLI